ncbi:MAG: hypothetical protein MRY74_09425 [Neomegalonema sp.]|nr:hypothetical protein [Neomegalonema sp.]
MDSAQRDPGASTGREAQAEEAAERVQARQAPQFLERTHGPRPLAAHLAAGAADLAQGASLALGVGDERFPWRSSLRPEAEQLAERLARHHQQRLARAIAEAGLKDFTAAIAGMKRANAAPPVRRPADPPVIWSAGSSRLFDYAPDATHAPAVLIAPSLINGWRILDLTRANSITRGLAARGLRPFLIDWGAPNGEERGFSVADYAARRLAPAIDAACDARGAPDRKIALLGHCMSGAIAAAGGLLAQRRVDRLILLAAPWYFAPMRPPKAATPSRRQLSDLIGACGAVFGGVPADVLDTLFFLRDPLQSMRKFPAFGRRRTRRAPDRLFVAVEDWLNEGLRLAAPAAQTLFVEWGLDDALVRRRWRVAGRRVDLRDFAGPLMVLSSRADTVVPHESAEAALRRARGPELAHASGGHVGMIVGRRARNEVWDRLAAFCARKL